MTAATVTLAARSDGLEAGASADDHAITLTWDELVEAELDQTDSPSSTQRARSDRDAS